MARRVGRPQRGTGWRFWHSEAGFTLVEVVLTLAILGVVTAAFAFFQSAGISLYTLGRQQSDLQQTVGFALEFETRELRQAASVAVSPDGSQVSYVDRDGQAASFYLDPPSGELRQEVTGGTPAERVVAAGVRSVSFRLVPGPSPLVAVQLTAVQGGQTETASALVAVRQP